MFVELSDDWLITLEWKTRNISIYKLQVDSYQGGNIVDTKWKKNQHGKWDHFLNLFNNILWESCKKRII